MDAGPLRRTAHRAGCGRDRRDARDAGPGLARGADRRGRAGGDPHAGRAGAPRGAERARRARRDRGAGRVERGPALVPRSRLLGLRHAAGAPAQHRREPGLVHAVHALPAGDQPGTPRGAPQLPDDGVGPHRSADRERVAARRSHGGSRGDAPRLRGAQGRTGAEVRGRVGLPSADDRRRPDARAAALDRSRRRGSRDAPGAGRDLRAPAAGARDGRPHPRCARAVRPRERARRARRRRLRPPLAVPARIARRARRRHRVRQQPALRRPARIRRPARGVLRDARGVQALAARPPRRRLDRPGEETRAATRAPDPRAAHPAREGDEQHLHGTGPPRRHRGELRRLPRPAGTAPHRRRRRRQKRSARRRTRRRSTCAPIRTASASRSTRRRTSATSPTS